MPAGAMDRQACLSLRGAQCEAGQGEQRDSARQGEDEQVVAGARPPLGVMRSWVDDWAALPVLTATY